MRYLFLLLLLTTIMVGCDTDPNSVPETISVPEPFHPDETVGRFESVKSYLTLPGDTLVSFWEAVVNPRETEEYEVVIAWREMKHPSGESTSEDRNFEVTLKGIPPLPESFDWILEENQNRNECRMPIF